MEIHCWKNFAARGISATAIRSMMRRESSPRISREIGDSGNLANRCESAT
jgi:hypothetical protein